MEFLTWEYECTGFCTHFGISTKFIALSTYSSIVCMSSIGCCISTGVPPVLMQHAVLKFTDKAFIIYLVSLSMVDWSCWIFSICELCEFWIVSTSCMHTLSQILSAVDKTFSDKARGWRIPFMYLSCEGALFLMNTLFKRFNLLSLDSPVHCKIVCPSVSYRFTSSTSFTKSRTSLVIHWKFFNKLGKFSLLWSHSFWHKNSLQLSESCLHIQRVKQWKLQQ